MCRTRHVVQDGSSLAKVAPMDEHFLCAALAAVSMESRARNVGGLDFCALVCANLDSWSAAVTTKVHRRHRNIMNILSV